MIVIQPTFDVASDFSEGLAVVGFVNIINDAPVPKLGYINSSGATVIPFQYYDAQNFSEGLAAVGIYKESFGEYPVLYGFIDQKGDTIITHQYQFASRFVNGRALVLDVVDKFFGYINSSGERIINLPDLDAKFAADFFEELALVGVETRINPLYYLDGRNWAQISNPQYIFKYIDPSGAEVIKLDALYNFASPFFEGLAMVSTQSIASSEPSRVGFINKNGNLVIDLNYNWGTPFSEGLALVGKIDDPSSPYLSYGYLDQQGNEVINFEYGKAFAFFDGLAWVFNAAFNGFIDKQGKEVIDLWRLELDLDPFNPPAFSEGLLSVSTPFSDDTPALIGWIDKRGEVVIKLQYQQVRRFSEGFAAVQVDGQWGYIYNPLIKTTAPAKKTFQSLYTVTNWEPNKTTNLRGYRK